jgi:RNA polymerase sigma-70 factor (ECF subfamily)
MPDPDRTLLLGIQNGDRRALEQLAQHYAPPVYRYLLRLCRDATLAEDLAQEVAVQLWRALPGRSFPNHRALNSWVYTVATNAFRMHQRRKRSSEVSLDEEIDLPAGSESDPAQTTERADLSQRVRSAVEALPEAERRALMLKTYGDLRYQEISAATGEPVGTVKWRISRAYERLRRLLAPEMNAGMGMEKEDESLRTAKTVSGRRDEAAGTLAHAAAPAALSGLFGAESR